MFGLFFGSWLIGKYVDKINNHLKWYAYLELSTGLYAILLVAGFGIVSSIFNLTHSVLSSIQIINLLVKFFLTLVFLVIPTSAMGATLPLAVQYYTKKKSSFGDNISMFYAVNTIGGAVGALLAGFLIIEFLGIREGIILTAVLNFIIALTVLLSIRKTGDKPVHTEKVKLKSKPPKKASGVVPNYKILLLTTAGLSGFAALAYEILWTRGLKFLILNSTYGFASILFVFLLGIAIGGVIAKRINGKIKNTFYVYGLLQIILGAFAIFTIFILYSFVYTTDFKNSLHKFIYDYSYGWGWGIVSFILSAVIIYIIPTILMGVLYPILNEIYFKNTDKKAGRTVSSIFAINTIGAILGVLTAGFVLIPSFGIKTSIYFISVINLALGVVFILKSNYKTTSTILLSVPLLAIVIILSTNGKYLFGNKESKNDSVVFYKEGLMATVKVYDRNKARYLSIDGIPIASTGRGLMQKENLIAHLPFFFKKNPDDVLAVGLASGISLGEMTLHKQVKQFDCVELIKPVFTAAKYFTDYNRNVFNNPKVNLIYNDIYSYLIHSKKKYDIISSDGKLGTLHSGNTIMLSKDYYELCKSHLKDDGIFTQWIPIITPFKATQIILKSLTTTFKYVNVFYFYPSDILMVASKSPIVFDKKHMDMIFANPLLNKELERYNIFNSLSILSAFTGKYSEDDVLTNEMNTFNKPVLEFEYIRDWKKSRLIKGGYRAKNLGYFTEHYAKSDTGELFENFINVNKSALRQSIYLPTLSFLEYETNNFIRGNYQLGLRAYVNLKRNLLLADESEKKGNN